MSVFEMAKKYYPRLWDKSRLEALEQAGTLTAEEAAEIIGGYPCPNAIPSNTRPDGAFLRRDGVPAGRN